jgi:hypothetical protein
MNFHPKYRSFDKTHVIQPGCLVAAVLFMLLISGNYAAAKNHYDPNHLAYDNLLKVFVADGLVNYAGLKQNPQQLKQYLNDLSQVKKETFAKWDKNQQLAYLINLYNAATLKLIVDNYPIESIKDIGSFFKGPWNQDVVKLFGDTITLNTLEHEIIRKDYDEPRIHIALVCAAKGCPPLRSEPYIGKKLDAQLDEQSKIFLRGSTGLQIDRQNKIVYASSIFKWYGEDFINKYTPQSGFKGFNETQQAFLNFCSLYLSQADQEYLQTGDYSIKYLNYDWSLNERQVKK